MAEEQKKKKQQYLVSEIMEPGYDPDEFVSYMQEQRQGGESVELS